MSRLEKIISALSPQDFDAIAAELKKNKAQNSWHLLETYRQKITDDNRIMSDLGISSGSLYTLKSRLFDRIQKHLSGNIFSSKEQVLEKLHEIPVVCLNSPREVAIAYLHKLEEDLKSFDLHTELIVVYSALKKLHTFSEKYFQYSQLFNKHMAYSLMIEKSEEILGTFNRALSDYDSSRSPAACETAVFLMKQLEDQYILSKSRQILIIKNLMQIQLDLFCRHQKGQNIGALLDETLLLIEALPEASPQKQWLPAVKALYFEFCVRNADLAKAGKILEDISGELERLLLAGYLIRTSFILPSLIIYYQLTENTTALAQTHISTWKKDEADQQTIIQASVFNAVSLYYRGETKTAVAHLNDLINEHSFKDKFHSWVEIRLLLVFFYLQLEDYDYAAHLLKNLSRKLKDYPEYEHLDYLINVYNGVLKNSAARNGKISEQLMLFKAHNKGRIALLSFMEHELTLKFSNPRITKR